jgi:hypothetical protein
VLRKPLVLLCLLVLAAVNTSGAQAAAVRPDSTNKAQTNQSGTWSAASSNGLTLMGTWTAVMDTTSGAVTGTWTLSDAQGSRLAYGGWSAAKSPTQWTGAWRAIVAGRNGEYSGTFTASADLKGDTRFVDLFEKAAQMVVSGTWQSGKQSGGWSIRAAKVKTDAASPPP